MKQLTLYILLISLLCTCKTEDKPEELNGHWFRTWKSGLVELQIVEHDSINLKYFHSKNCKNLHLSARSQNKFIEGQWTAINWNYRDTSFSSQLLLNIIDDTLKLKTIFITDTVNTYACLTPFQNSAFDRSYQILCGHYLMSEKKVLAREKHIMKSSCLDENLIKINAVLRKIEKLKEEILGFSTLSFDSCDEITFIPHDNNLSDRLLFGPEIINPVKFPMYKLKLQLESLLNQTDIRPLVKEYSLLNLEDTKIYSVYENWEIAYFYWPNNSPSTLTALSELQTEILELKIEYLDKYCG